MITYIIIGLIVSLLIRIERAITRPEFWSVDWKAGITWGILLGGTVVDAVVWPLAIICEIITIIFR